MAVRRAASVVTGVPSIGGDHVALLQPGTGRRSRGHDGRDADAGRVGGVRRRRHRGTPGAAFVERRCRSPPLPPLPLPFPFPPLPLPLPPKGRDAVAVAAERVAVATEGIRGVGDAHAALTVTVVADGVADEEAAAEHHERGDHGEGPPRDHHAAPTRDGARRRPWSWWWSSPRRDLRRRRDLRPWRPPGAGRSVGRRGRRLEVLGLGGVGGLAGTAGRGVRHDLARCSGMGPVQDDRGGAPRTAPRRSRRI